MRSVLAGLALLMPGVAGAQTAPLYTAEYIDAHRPVVVKRALSASEKAEARALVARIEAAPSEALLDRLRPLANSGDVALMTAMWKGYGKAILTTVPIDDRFRQAGVILQAQWAIQLWRAGEQDRDVALSISNCFGGPYAGQLVQSRPCGYVATLKKPNRANSFSSYVSKIYGKPDVTFTETRPVLEPGWAERKFEQVVADLRDRRKVPSVADLDFADATARHRGQAMLDWWTRLTWLHKARPLGDAARTRAATEADSAERKSWNEIVRRFRADESLSDADRDAWFRLSVRIGGDALKTYGAYFPLTEAWQVDAYCVLAGEADKALCTLRRLELRMMRTTPTAGGDDVPLRSYDMAGSPGRTVYVARSSLRKVKR